MRDAWDIPSQKARYARAYANATPEVRSVMKTMGTSDALRYAESCDVPNGTPGGIAGGIIGAIDRGARENGYQREPGDEQE